MSGNTNTHDSQIIRSNRLYQTTLLKWENDIHQAMDLVDPFDTNTLTKLTLQLQTVKRFHNDLMKHSEPKNIK